MSLVISGQIPILAVRLFRRAALAAALALIGLVVGVGCVILPLAAPFGIIAAIGLILLWVMPDRHAVTGRYQRWITLVFLFSIITVPAYFTLVFPGLPWISLRRVILFAFLASTLLTLATSREDRYELAITLRASKLAAYLLAALIGLWGLSILGSKSPVDSIVVALNQHAVWIISLTAAIIVFRTQALLRRALVLVTFCAFADFLVGGIEFFLKKPYLFYLIPASMRSQLIDRNLYLISLLVGSGVRNGLYRAASVFTGPLSWGEMAAMTAPLGAYFATESRSRIGKLYGGIIVISCLLSIYCSGSRGAYVGFLVSMLAYSIFWAIRNVRLRPNSLIGGILLIVISMGALGVVSSIFFIDRINKTVLGNGQAQVSTEARSAQWQLAQPYVLSRPVVGYGIGQAAGLVNYSAAPGAPVSLDSYAITLLVELGIPGFLSYIGLFCSLIGGCAYTFIYRSGSNADMAGGLSCSMISYLIYRLTLSQFENNFLVFALVGMSFRLLYLVRSETPDSDTLSNRR